MKFGKLALGAAALGALTTGAMAQDPDEGNLLGIEGGLYFPQDAILKDIFGDSILKVGFNYGNPLRQADQWRLTSNFNFITASKDGNRFFLLPVTAAFGRMFGEQNDPARPYVRAGVGFAYMDYRVEVAPGDDRRGSKVVPTWNAEVGVVLSNRLRLAGSYNWFGETDGLDFSGFQLTLSYSIIKF